MYIKMQMKNAQIQRWHQLLLRVIVYVCNQWHVA